MDVMFNFIVKYKDEILVGVMVTTVSGLLIAFLSKIIIIVKTKFFPNPLQEPEEAIYLNIPPKSLDDKCMGRHKLLEEVFNEIRNGEKNQFIRKCIAITGEEGMGKSLFCYTLFQYRLKKCPVYLGWIECNGKQSIFDIIKINFKDSRFHRKNKDGILNAFNSMNKMCILFVDQVDQYTPIDELEEISHSTNVILIVSGLLKKINFADCTFELQPLPEKVVYKIFKWQSGEDVELMYGLRQKSVKRLLGYYTNGNPFLTIAIAKAKYHYNGKWEDVLDNMERLEYIDDENYLRNILKQLYKIRELDIIEKNALSKLSTIQYKEFVEVVFEWLDITEYYVNRLCNTYWLKQEDNIMYSMDDLHRNIIKKVLKYDFNLRNTIITIYSSLSRWELHKDNGFRWISAYVEEILKEIQGYATHIMDEEIFSEFAWVIATEYANIGNKEKCLEWLNLCRPQSAKLAFRKAYIEFRTKAFFLDTLFSRSEVEQIYYIALEKAKEIDNFEDNKRFLMNEYCRFLIKIKQYDKAVLLCEKYFKIYDMDLSNVNNCCMFRTYLYLANSLNKNEVLKRLINDATIQDLYKNDKISISVAWCFGELGQIYKKWGDKEVADIYMRHMVVLLNEERCFFHMDIESYLEFSDEEFAEYMHSCDELSDSLIDALKRKDAEALYIEGRYQEKYGNYGVAFTWYEEAAARDSLRGICSLALLYYRGQGVTRNYEKARRYWEYCCERGHRGSYYWLSILLLDKDYSHLDHDYDKDGELALQYLATASELGSERAKQKLLEL